MAKTNFDTNETTTFDTNDTTSFDTNETTNFDTNETTNFDIREPTKTITIGRARRYFRHERNDEDDYDTRRDDTSEKKGGPIRRKTKKHERENRYDEKTKRRLPLLVEKEIRVRAPMKNQHTEEEKEREGERTENKIRENTLYCRGCRYCP
jgi:hypothetical protein